MKFSSESKELIEFDDEKLISILIEHKSQIDENQLQTIKNILKNRDIHIDIKDINIYIENFLKDFHNGCHNTIRKMFIELVHNGWNTDIQIDSKEKYGILFCSIHSHKHFQNILDKHIQLIQSFCPKCGRNDHDLFEDDTNPSWISYTCYSCWEARVKELFTISNICQTGFNYNSHKIDDLIVQKQFYWQDIKSIELNFYDRFADGLSLNIEFLDEEGIYISNRVINFYKLLKNIPNIYLTEIDLKYRENLIISLRDCIICGKISIFENSCLVCGRDLNRILRFNRNVKSWKRYNNIDKIVITEQNSFKNEIKKLTPIRYRYDNDSSFHTSTKFSPFINSHKITD